MNSVLVGILVSTVPLIALGVVGLWRWRLPAILVVLIATIASAVGVGILAPSDVWVVPVGLGMNAALLTALMWTLFGAVARTAGPLDIPGPPWVVAMGMGACLGEIPAAAILSAGASSPKGAARLALAAAGGGLIGRVGDPAMLLLAGDHPVLLLALAPLGVLMAFVVRPRREDVVETGQGNRARTAVVALVACVSLVPAFTAWALLAGMLGLGLLAQDRRGHVDLAAVGWQLCAILLAIIAIVGGSAEQVAYGLEWGTELADWLATPVLTVAAALLTAFTDSMAMSVFFSGVLDRAASVDSAALIPGLTAGIAVGGLGPLIAAGSVRSGFGLWLVQLVLAVGWAVIWALT